MSAERKFRVAFPCVTLPANFGGKRAIVMFSVSSPKQANIHFSTCVDIDGQVHQNVPFSVIELMNAARKPCNMTEVEVLDGPAPSMLVTP
jgi:hypothetical protein